MTTVSTDKSSTATCGGLKRAHRTSPNGAGFARSIWRGVPERYGPRSSPLGLVPFTEWQTCWDRFTKWERSGDWQRI